MRAKITRAQGGLNIFLPIEDVHALRIALQPCPCKAAKSNKTADTRTRLERGLAKALFSKIHTK